MLRLIAALTVLGVSAACTLGPGVRCNVDGDCQGWGRCEKVSGVGYCVVSGAEQQQAPAQEAETAAVPAPPEPSDLAACTDGGCTYTPPIDAPPSQTPPATGSGTSVPTPSETDGGLATVAPAQLTFGSGGFVPCGTRATAQSVGITNINQSVLQLTYVLDAASAPRFRVSGPASLDVGGSATVTVTPEPIPATASIAPDALGGMLTITAQSRTRSESFPIALHQTAQGAVLSFTPTALDFRTEWGKKQNKPFTLSNRGNLAASFVLTVTGADPLHFSGTPSTGQVAVGANVSGQATFIAPLIAPKERSATLSLTTTAAVCAPLPVLNLSGSVK